MRGRHPYTWGQDHPLVVDGLLALAFAAAGIATEVAAAGDDPNLRDPDDLSGLLTLATTLPLVLRRRHPLAVFWVVMAATTAYSVAEYPGIGPLLGLLVALYGSAAYLDRRKAIACLLVTLLVIVGGTLAYEDNGGVVEIVGVGAVFLTSWMLGDNMRVRRAYVAAVEDRAAQLERERDAQARRAVLEERTRIARELHDVVAHSMSVMVVQAGAARRTLDRDPGRAAEAIGHIESTGRGALAEMRRLVGVLRGAGDAEPAAPADRPAGPDEGPARPPPDEQSASESEGPARQLSRAEGPPPLLPQPDIAQLPTLTRQCQEAGLDVTLQMEGRPRPLPSGIELVVYRIVQEALTNTMRHAGPARAEVHLDYGETTIAVTITDDGRGAAANGWHQPSEPGAPRVAEGPAAPVGPRPAPGHGLAGMHERVALYGGQITTGPRPGGGFRVWAEIPLADVTETVGPSDPAEPVGGVDPTEPDRAGPGVASGGRAS